MWMPTYMPTRTSLLVTNFLVSKFITKPNFFVAFHQTPFLNYTFLDKYTLYFSSSNPKKKKLFIVSRARTIGSEAPPQQYKNAKKMS